MLGDQRGRKEAGALTVRCQGSTNKVTTGGDHLAPGSRSPAATGGAGGAAATAAVTGCATAPIGGKPEAGMGRALLAGGVTAAGSFAQGSVMRPCCASAALATSSDATRTLILDRGPKATLSIAQHGHSGQ